MTSKTNEQALEASIEKKLTGHCQEELKAQSNRVSEAPELYRGGNGYYIGNPSDYDPQFAIDKERFWDFLESTQKEELEKIQRQSNWKRKILERFDRMIKKYGVLHLLKKGLDVDDAHFTLFYQLPLASSSQSVKDKFESNQFSVTRQLRYSVDNPREEIDMVVFLNGIPVATIELKNHWTGQSAKVHGINQYKYKRDNKQPLLQFARCIVHFTVDTDEAYMTTKLNGGKTFFLPFNKGNNMGKGNPPNPLGHKTAYLWEEVFTRKSLANIIQHFVRLDGKPKDPLNKRTLFFPRYHQMDVVRKITAHIAENGVGNSYLLMHSAGSGKSNSITWAAYQLIETYPLTENARGSREAHLPLFDSVIVVTDRRLLDKQIRENIKGFSEVKNIVAPAHTSKELKENLEAGKKIIISTIQKFPFILDGISDLSERRFAVLIDEAHSSQGGSASAKMNQAMGHNSDEDTQDKILSAMKARKMKRNASYLAFTATPKNATLEKFGTKTDVGSFKPFHLYSMKQAIEEGFIHDVIANYTTYKSYYEIQKSIEDNPLFDTKKAQKKLRSYVERHKQTIRTKAEIMLDNFMSKTVQTKKLKGKAKAMVVTQNIESAIRYYQAIRQMLKDKGMPFDILVAFSDKKKVDGVEYSEEGINNLPAHLDIAKPTDPDYISDKLARYFDMDEYRILVVANKYLTGFDQPKLTNMYVDKKLQGVLAVQALSRLNRANLKLGKRTEDIFVLDFFNSTDDIKKAFDPFYTSTTLSSATDINVLHELKATLDEVGVYEWHEVEDFVEQYFDNVPAEQLSPIIDVAANRFNDELNLEEEDKADFKIKAKQFVKIYGQVASIMPYEVKKWELLYWFVKFLIPKLVVIDKEKQIIDELLESVDLSTYGLERIKLNHAIGLDDTETELDPQNPNPRGAYDGDKEEDHLDEIISNFNERWFQGWDATPEDQRIKFVQISDRVKAHPDFKEKFQENPDNQNRDLALRRIIEEVFAKQRKQDIELYKLHAKDEAFNLAMFDTLKMMVEGRVNL